MNADARTVLVVGGTGALGRHVVEALRRHGKPVRALVRPGSDATVLEAAGVEVVRGDMLDAASLRPAFSGVDAVITSAAGYTRRRSTDTGQTDVLGNRNLADAARREQVRRFVFTGILRSDEASAVPHFWNKELAERYLADQGVRYVSLRPAAFFDQIMDLLPGGGLRGGQLVGAGPRTLRQSYVLSTDVATALAALVDAPVTDGEHIDLGWDRPVSLHEIAVIAAPVLARKIRTLTIPAPLLKGVLGMAGRVSEQAADLGAMFEFFGTGRFVADTTRQSELLGSAPTAEEAIRRWAAARPLTREPMRGWAEPPA